MASINRVQFFGRLVIGFLLLLIFIISCLVGFGLTAYSSRSQKGKQAVHIDQSVALKLYTETMILDFPEQAQYGSSLTGQDFSEGWWQVYVLTYQSSPRYAEILLQHDKVKENNMTNRRIKQENCKYAFPTAKSLNLTVEQKEFLKKGSVTCYEGAIFPYQHKIAIDGETGSVVHRVNDYRE